jgi:hypothetical protein
MEDIIDKLFALVVLIIIFGSIFGFPYAMARTKQKERERREETVPKGETLNRLERLEERVKVLERIVTDERAELSRQFREL